MLKDSSLFHAYIEAASRATGRDSSKSANFLVVHILSKSDEENVANVRKALIEVLPPEIGSSLLCRLQILGTYWAWGLVRNGIPSLDQAEIRSEFIRRSFRLSYKLEAELIKEGLSAHCELFTVLQDRFWALSKLSSMVRRLASSREQPRELATFVEPGLIAGTAKSHLRDSLIRHHLRQLSSQEKRRFRTHLLRAIDEGLARPWEPEFEQAQLDMGIDILVTDGLAQGGPFQISSLVKRIKPSGLIRPGDNLGFLSGLCRNEHFVRSAQQAKELDS